MLINSDFKDYYDPMQKHGVDKLVVYNRKRQEFLDRDKCPPLEPLLKELHDLRAWAYRESWLSWPMFLVGFCGELHLGFHLHYFDNFKTRDACVYDIEHFEGFLRDTDPRLLSVFNKTVKTRKRFFGKDRIEFERGDVERAFAHFKKPNSTLFQKLKAPVFWVTQDNGYLRPNRVINPCLKKIEFQQVKPPQVAYQELSMFISGVLGTPERPMVKISDVDMAAKKGFDKWSFRKKVR